MKWITISRKLGTHGSEIARRVAEALDYRLYDTAAIGRMAQVLGISDSVAEADEKTPSLFLRLFSHKPAVCFDRLYSVIYELAKAGNAVFLGRGSHILLRAFGCALHVRVTASAETRLRILAERGLHPEEAARAMKQSDDERAGFIRLAFGENWERPELYDLVLNMDKLSVDAAAQTVVDLARSPGIVEASTEAVRSLEMLGLSARAEAALLEAGFSSGRVPSVRVAAVEPGKVQLTGFVDSEARRGAAERALRDVAGVAVIENTIQVLRPPTAV
jgi:cytidylate kinase